MFQFLKKYAPAPDPVPAGKIPHFYGGFVPAGTGLERRLLSLYNQLDLIPRDKLREGLLILKELSAVQMATNIAPRPEGEAVDVLRADEAPIYSVDLFLETLEHLENDRDALAEAIRKQEEKPNG